MLRLVLVQAGSSPCRQASRHICMAKNFKLGMPRIVLFLHASPPALSALPRALLTVTSKQFRGHRFVCTVQSSIWLRQAHVRERSRSIIIIIITLIVHASMHAGPHVHICWRQESEQMPMIWSPPDNTRSLCNTGETHTMPCTHAVYIVVVREQQNQLPLHPYSVK